MTSDPSSTTDVRPTVDLVSSPWITVVDHGEETEVSLREAIVNAHRIDSLSLADGPIFAGQLRLLMAVVMDAYGRPRDVEAWEEMFRAGSFDAELFDSYIERCGRTRFDLYGAERPFFQSAAMTAEDAPKTNAEIIPHVAAGKSPALFSPDTSATPRVLTPAQAARHLIGFMGVAVAGLGRAKASEGAGWKGVSFGGRVAQIGFVAPVGTTLFDTLLLNVPWGRNPRKDRPQWRRDSPPPAGRSKRGADGMLDILTWCPRRVLLLPNEDGTVIHLRMLGGDALIALDTRHEPHTEWRTSDGKDKHLIGEVYPRKHRPSTLGWRGLPTLLALRRTEEGEQSSLLFEQLAERIAVLGKQYPIATTGLMCEFGTMGATYSNITFDFFTLPSRAFGADELNVRSELVDMARAAEKVRSLIYTFAKSVAFVVLHDTTEKEKEARPAAALFSDQFTTEIEAITRRFLAGATKHPSAVHEGITAWREDAYALGLGYRDAVMNTANHHLISMLVVSKEGKDKVLGMPPTVSSDSFTAALRRIFTPPHPAPAPSPDPSTP